MTQHIHITDPQGNYGRYDDICLLVAEKTNARAVLLVVIGGSSGNGMSVSAADPVILTSIPDILIQLGEGMKEKHLASHYSEKIRDYMSEAEGDNNTNQNRKDSS